MLSLRVIDTETCGLQGGIVEIASVDVINGKITNPMSDLVCPDRPITPQATYVHRITEAMVKDKPPIEQLIERYHGSHYYVAHNAQFDRKMLPEMHGEWICTMKLARQLWPGRRYSNQALREDLELDVTPPDDLHAHRALYDCYVTTALLIRIMEVSAYDPLTMVRLCQPATAAVSTLPFGKYRGYPIKEIAEREPRYLHWMLNNIPTLTPGLRRELESGLRDES
ncbi:MAG: Exodeoxyribonuclease 10 [Candidatus Erwinia impunctatus]|nr:Exodeoxyribonuclease 10 [Culicoides impunctatus]